MKIFKELFARIWALWGIVSFLISFLIIFLPSMFCYVLPTVQGQKTFIAIAKYWMMFWLFIIGCPVRVRGKNNFALNTAYIVTCNHNALLDIPLSSPFIPGPNKTIAKTSFTKIPLFGWYYRKGSVLVDRNKDSSRRKSFEEMKTVLKLGMHMCIYPEGTRNRTKEPLKKFYDGAFKLAVDTGTAIIPAVILHTKKAMPIHKFFYLWPHNVEIHFLNPITPIHLSVEELKEKVYNIMSNYYIENEN